MIVIEASFEKSAPALKDATEANLPEVCFVGRSNVGKSSALNALTRRHQLARVSKTPGRTRLLNFFRVTLADKAGAGRRTGTLRLCDLPGYGYAEGPKADRKTWGAMIGSYLLERSSLCAVVVLVDAHVGVQPKDLEMMAFLAETPLPVVVVATKADRVSRTRMGSQLDRIAKDLGVPRKAVLPFSAHEGTGHKELWQTLAAATNLLGRTQTDKLIGAPDDMGDETSGEATA
ncbi:MAG: putative GTP-binding protein YihA [Pseudomonadota bacterium]